MKVVCCFLGFSWLFSPVYATAKVAETTGSGVSIEADETVYHVPVFSMDELLLKDTTNTKYLEDLQNVLSDTGLISIIGDADIFSRIRQETFSGMCECFDTNARDNNNNNVFSSVRGADSGMLRDGTTRTSIATATVGDTPLPLAKQDLLRVGCSETTVDAAESMRDIVAWASHAFMKSLDRLLLRNGQANILLTAARNTPFYTISSIVKASQNLEHFHVYSKQEEEDAIDQSNHGESSVLDVHTDAGLFLAFVPGMRCNGADDSSDFYVSVNGSIKKAVFPPGSIGIMLGMGAERWLQTPLPLRATRHAVKMESGQRRAWYGLMHLVPQDAIIQDFPQRTFADMRKAMVLQGATAKRYKDISSSDIDTSSVAVGCGSSSSTFSDTNSLRIDRRRLEMVEDARSCNNVTNFFCWMSCLEIPEADKAKDFIDDGYSLYCLDPATLLKNNNSVAVATDVCNSGGVVGGAHNDACIGAWQPTVPGIPSQDVKSSPSAVEESFCYGGTSMFMDGFHWTDSTCVIYLFPEWVLDSVGSMVGACVGTLFFGIAVEGVIWKRRQVVQAMPVGWKKLGVSTLFYGLQLTLGYMIMLVVMTYSGPLFMCVIFGLMSGHLLFSWIGAYASIPKESHDKVSATPEPSNFEPGPADMRKSCCEQARKNNCYDSIPEGSTPCCQNYL